MYVVHGGLVTPVFNVAYVVLARYESCHPSCINRDKSSFCFVDSDLLVALPSLVRRNISGGVDCRSGEGPMLPVFHLARPRTRSVRGGHDVSSRALSREMKSSKRGRSSRVSVRTILVPACGWRAWRPRAAISACIICALHYYCAMECSYELCCALSYCSTMSTVL